MIPHIVTLPNGLKVVFIDIKSLPSLTSLLLISAGSRYEHKDNNGIAHFFEHMAFKGSKKYPSAFTISSTIEGEGGYFNAFTGKDNTGYWIKALAEDFDKIIDVMSDMVLHPLLVKDEIEREKGVIVEEINMYEDNPSRKVGVDFETLLYKGHPLGFDIAGTKETVNSFERQTFVDYINSYYHPENATLVIAGGIADRQKLLTLVEEKFGAWQTKPKLQLEPLIEKQTKPAIFVKYKKTEQAHFCLGFRAFSFMDARRYVLAILSTILGGGMSSRLFMEVRERRGLCYYISSGRELYFDVGNFVTQAGVTNNIDKVKESIEVILKEHKKVAGGEITQEELTRAKELIKGRLLLSMEDSMNVASFYGNKILLEGNMEGPKEVVDRIEAVTIDEVSSLAAALFKPQTLNFSIIGPFKPSQITIADFGEL